MRLPTITVAGQALALLAAGAFQPASAAQAEATVIFFGPGTPSFCSARPGPALKVVDREGYRMAAIPAGQRLTILNPMRINMAPYMYSNCVPGIAFLPPPAPSISSTRATNTRNAALKSPGKTRARKQA